MLSDPPAPGTQPADFDASPDSAAVAERLPAAA